MAREEGKGIKLKHLFKVFVCRDDIERVLNNQMRQINERRFTNEVNVV